MKNILVPTDFSTEAHYAYEVALQLARYTGGNVTLLHLLEAMDDAGGGFSTSGSLVGGTRSIEEIFPIKLMEATRRRMHTLQEEAARLVPEVPVQVKIKAVAVEEGILHAIERYASDLVVMGARGHGAVEHLFVSSNTERMIRLAPCPVMAVKHRHAPFAVRNIVFPSDFSAEAAGALNGLRQVQHVFPKATVHLLHVVSGRDKQAAEQQMLAFAQEHHLTNYTAAAVGAGRASTGIEQYAQSVQADLVVMPTHTRSLLAGLLHTSTAENVATHAYPPVLTYHFQ